MMFHWRQVVTPDGCVTEILEVGAVECARKNIGAFGSQRG